MIKRVYWYDVALRLRDYLVSYRNEDGKRLFDYLVDRDDLKIRVGYGNTGEYPALFISFGSEEDIKKQGAITGAEMELWLDLYVKGESTDDLDYDDVLYRHIYMAENELIEALNKYSHVLQRSGLGCNLVVSHILSDGDENAPAVVAHRLLVRIEWRV